LAMMLRQLELEDTIFMGIYCPRPRPRPETICASCGASRLAFYLECPNCLVRETLREVLGGYQTPALGIVEFLTAGLERISPEIPRHACDTHPQPLEQP